MNLPKSLEEVESITEKIRANKETTVCWSYTDHRNRGGYAIFPLPDGTTKLAAQHVLELAGRPVREGYVVIRKCRNVFCCNPEHLSDIPKWYADTTFKKDRDRGMKRKRLMQTRQVDLKLP